MGFRAGVAALLLGCVGCGTPQGKPDLAITYNRSAAFEAPDRNPIIAIPGLLGSKLRDEASQAMVWGAFDMLSVDPDSPEGLRLLSLPIGAGDEPLAQLRDRVEPYEVLDRARVTIFGIPIELEVYAGILATLGVGGYRDEALGLAGEIDYGDDHFTCFQYPYDWRRDIVESAQRLMQFVREKQTYVRAQYRERYGVENADVKFDIATHSMGGLVARYFLMYGDQDLPADGSLPELTWAGAAYVERVIFVGTPNAGSVEAFENLVNGKSLGPLMPLFSPSLIGTYPSTYQLLPRSRHGLVVWDGDLEQPVEDLMDPDLWARSEWGLAAPNQDRLLTMLMPDVADADERRRRAISLQARILHRAAALHAALDRPAAPPDGLDMLLVAGDGHRTPKIASVSSQTGDVAVIEYGDGDGTVLRSSALMDERVGGPWSPRVKTPIGFHSVLFLPEEHINLTKIITFRDNILFWLLEDPRGDTRADG